MSSISWPIDSRYIYLDRDARPTGFGQMEVVHVGHSAVVLEDVNTERLLVITGESSGLMPGGVRLRDLDFAAVRSQVTGFLGDSVTIETVQRTPAASLIDLHIASGAVDDDAVEALSCGIAATGGRNMDQCGSVMDPTPIRERAQVLAEAAVRKATHDVQTLVTSLIGVGPGTTPTGDDVIVGVLAGCALVGDQPASSIIGVAVTPLLCRTTVASRHYLSAAIDGRFGEHVHELVSAISGLSSPRRALLRATTWGSSSGIDVLAGLLAISDIQQFGWLTKERSA